MRRPADMSEYVGQSKIRPLLLLELKTGALRPTLIFGRSGSGKTALAHALGAELKTEFKEVVARESWDEKTVYDMLMDLSIEGYDSKGIAGPDAKATTLFIDECHTLSRSKALVHLLKPVEDSHVYGPDGSPNWLPNINWIFATDSPEKIAGPLFNRLKIQLHLQPYSIGELGQIIKLNFPKMPQATIEDIAKRSKFNARIALSHAESVELYDGDSAMFFGLMDIDERGLDQRDRDYLRILEEADRPLSLSSLASSLLENVSTVKLMEEVLIHMKLVTISPSGRCPAGKQARGKRG